jgi:translation initiation factor IF-3
VNHRIRVPEVRVVYEDEQLGILSRDDALRAAQEKGLDLVEIAARSNPPVCRIMDYGRFKYEQSKKQKAAKKHSSSIEVKEVKFRPKTDSHDLDFKVRHVVRFLEEGNKCRLVVIFRGREVTHPETGVAVLDKVIARTSEIAQVDMRPTLEGKRMTMILGPKAGVVKRAPKRPAAEPAPERVDAKVDDKARANPVDGAKPAPEPARPQQSSGGSADESAGGPEAAEARDE